MLSNFKGTNTVELIYSLRRCYIESYLYKKLWFHRNKLMYFSLLINILSAVFGYVLLCIYGNQKLTGCLRKHSEPQNFTKGSKKTYVAWTKVNIFTLK